MKGQNMSDKDETVRTRIGEKGTTRIEKPWEYNAQVTRVIDGDTVEVSISKTVTYDFGFNYRDEITRSFKMRLRLHGLDTPEVYGVKKGSPEYVAGKAASKFTADWLTEHCELSVDGFWLVHLKTHDTKHLDQARGKYHGRWVAEVWTRDKQLSLNQALIDAGHDKHTRDA
jgi:micrococcal nuclease